MGQVGDTWAQSGTKGATTYSIFMNTVGHAVVGCAQSEASGGSCRSGAMAGAFSAAWSNYGPGYASVDGASVIIQNTMTAALVGGVSSKLGGRMFWNGAQTGAFGYLFNYCAHNGCFDRRFDFNDAVDQ
jgi:hypothetical protein